MAKNKKGGSKKQSSANLAKATANASAKKQSQSNQKQGKKGLAGFFSYIRGVRQEFSKVVWPTREELVTDTVVVFATVVFFSLAFWLIDTGFLAALKGILGITLS
jgi:preprotein translocase subunit SecE